MAKEYDYLKVRHADPRIREDPVVHRICDLMNTGGIFVRASDIIARAFIPRLEKAKSYQVLH